MSDRTYLSIGDVLTLLRQEFPDVTISKIRFLESQGLVDPERTPSGYRKFYDHDVERLRWVLRQQREHFLPLKVIKGRLESEAAPATPNGQERRGERAENGRSGAREAAREDAVVPEHDEEKADGEPAERSPLLLSERSAQRGAELGTVRGPGGSPEAGAGASAGEGARSDEGAGAAAVGLGSRAAASTREGATASSSASREPSGQELPGLGGKAEASRARATAGGRSEVRSHPSAGALRASRTQGSESATVRPVRGISSIGAFSGASMTIDELARASGLETSAIQKLESHGLLCGRAVGGTAYYDEDALLVAKLASSFADYGVEARHLRLHLLAAQREAGFVEQIVLPLLKQRNPASRNRAQETVVEMSRLGQELHAVLLRRAIRELLGG